MYRKINTITVYYYSCAHYYASPPRRLLKRYTRREKFPRKSSTRIPTGAARPYDNRRVVYIIIIIVAYPYCPRFVPVVHRRRTADFNEPDETALPVVGFPTGSHDDIFFSAT